MGKVTGYILSSMICFVYLMKKLKTGISIIICVLLVTSTFVGFVNINTEKGINTVDAQSVPNALEPSQGSGTDADPYIVTDAKELQYIAENTTAHYELSGDIDASETKNWNKIDSQTRNVSGVNDGDQIELYYASDDGTIDVKNSSDGSVSYKYNEASNSITIDDSSVSSSDLTITYDVTGDVYKGFKPTDLFEGVLDGNGSIISNLYINRPDETNVGVIGTLGESDDGDASTPANVKRIGFKNSYVRGNEKVGVIAGEIKAASPNGGGKVENSFVLGEAISEKNHVGLITSVIGHKSGLSKVYAVGETEGEDFVGGVVSQTDRVISEGSTSISEVYSAVQPTTTTDNGDYHGFGFGGYGTSGTYYDKKLAPNSVNKSDVYSGKSLNTSEMQGATADDNMQSLTFGSSGFDLVTADNNIGDWYPVLSTFDENQQISIDVEGKVVDKSGLPVSNATVELYAMNPAFDASDYGEFGDDTTQSELLDRLTNPTPKGFSSDKFSAKEIEAGSDIIYPVVSRPSDLETGILGGIFGGLTGSDVIYENDETLLFTAWDASDTSIIPRTTEDPFPGFHISERKDIELHRLDYRGDRMSEIELTTRPIAGTLIGQNLHGARLDSSNIEAGYYEVEVAEEDQFSYMIQIGSKEEMRKAYLPNLNNDKGDATEIKKQIQKLKKNDDLVQLRTVTDENGHFVFDSSELPGNNLGEIMAYKHPEVISSPDLDGPATLKTIRSYYSEQLEKDEIPAQIMSTSEPVRTPIPRQGIELELEKFTPEGISISEEKEAKNQTKEQMDNENFGELQGRISDLESKVDDLMSNLNESDKQEYIKDLEEKRNELKDIIDKNKNSISDLEDQIKGDSRIPDVEKPAIPSPYDGDGGSNLPDYEDSVEDLQSSGLNETEVAQIMNEQVSDLESTLANQQDEIDFIRDEVDTDTDVIDEGTPNESSTVDLTLPIDSSLLDSSDITKENVVVKAIHSNGETDLVPDENIDIDTSMITNDVIRIEDYELPEGVAQTNFVAEIVTSDSTGTSPSVPVENPIVSGSVPEIDNIDVNSLTPFKGQSVVMDVTFEEAGEIVDAEVETSSEKNVTPTVSDNKIEFKTVAYGEHKVNYVVEDSQGNQYNNSVSLFADDIDRDINPSVRVVEDTSGIYTITGDGAEYASVERTGDGVDIGINTEEDDRTPIRIYGHAVSNTHNYDIQLLKEEGEALAEERTILLHVPSVGENTLVYRNDEPIVLGSGKVQETDTNSNIIRTFTESDGSVKIRKSPDPGLLEEVSYTVDEFIGGFDLFSSIGL